MLIGLKKCLKNPLLILLGLGTFEPSECDRKLGSYIELPKETK
jgi:hypothetical protein